MGYGIAGMNTSSSDSDFLYHPKTLLTSQYELGQGSATLGALWTSFFARKKKKQSSFCCRMYGGY